ncbi:MAG TPA: hypothetical protein VK525_10960 [Candidatus Saccharimonadales bacterium]|nr:hypothetical protein [Candidatus Saccharimonadales bacterium]
MGSRFSRKAVFLLLNYVQDNLTVVDHSRFVDPTALLQTVDELVTATVISNPKLRGRAVFVDAMASHCI